MSSLNFWRNKFKELLENDFQWLDRSYAVDWMVATTFWALSILATWAPVFKREFSVDDPLINFPHTKEQVNGNMLIILSLHLPIIVACVLGAYRGSLIEIHHGTLALWSGRGLTRLITEFLKSRVGRLRPDFLVRCRWDAALKACTGNAHDILGGRRSFPSGHSSAAFASMSFISLLLAGKTAAWCFGSPSGPASIRASKLARLSMTFIPLFFATWVAVSRVEDYRHHKEDVIAGSLIGIFSSTLCYLMFWPSPFSLRNFAQERLGKPRLLYTTNERLRNAGFELTRLDDELETV